MNNYLSMSADFERQKNQKAYAITFGVGAALLLLFILVKWPIPTLSQPPSQEFIEVNLGNSDFGSGTDQPLLPGEPAPAEQVAYTPPQPIAQTKVNDAKDIDTDDRPTNDAVALKRPAASKPKAQKIDSDNKVVKTNSTPQPVISEAPPRPKAVLGRTVGGLGNGGNGAETYNPTNGNEGIAGGAGDQGRVGGSPTGTDYTGAPKSFGVKVFNIPAQSFEDEFNENAKVAMDIVVDANGKVKSATFQPRGSTTSNKNTIEIARRRAFELKLGSTDGGQKGTVVFNFKLRS